MTAASIERGRAQELKRNRHGRDAEHRFFQRDDVLDEIRLIAAHDGNPDRSADRIEQHRGAEDREPIHHERHPMADQEPVRQDHRQDRGLVDEEADATDEQDDVDRRQHADADPDDPD